MRYRAREWRNLTKSPESRGCTRPRKLGDRHYTNDAGGEFILHLTFRIVIEAECRRAVIF